MTSYPYFVYIRSDAPCTEIRCSFRFPGDDTAQSYSPLSTLLLRAIAMERGLPAEFLRLLSYEDLWVPMAGASERASEERNLSGDARAVFPINLECGNH